MRSTSKKINIRGLKHHIQEWGNSELPSLFILHGWMDCGSSFEYIASHLSEQFHIIAPDLRGFGETEHAQGGYWFPDYFADLDALLEQYSPLEKVNLVGHSMGGNIALMYSGMRPDRIKRVMSLEALGLKNSSPEDSPEKYRQWLSQSNTQKGSKTYSNLGTLQDAIRANNPTLSDEILRTLALSWSKPVDNNDPDGELTLKHDPKHRHVNPIRYNHDDAIALWQLVEAEVGLVMADNSSIYKQYLKSGRIEDAKDTLKVSHEHYYLVENSQHMLHLEQAESTADCIKSFFSNKP
jgi:pimeloyl-ACP methyl ester carboxylesterase